MATASSGAWADLRNGRSALDNDQFVHNGFQGQTSPDAAAVPPQVYDASNPRLAIQSRACAPFRSDVGQCLKYFEADAFISFGDSISNGEVDSFAAIHPWQGTVYAERVIVRHVSSLDELRETITGLVQDCYVLRHVLISSHGNQEHLAFYKDGDFDSLENIGDVVGNSGLPCALAPVARVQFDGCSVACQDSKANGAADILAMLTSLARDPDFVQKPGQSPFEETAWLFNSDEGLVSTPFLNWLLKPGWHHNEGISAADNSAIMYTFGASGVTTDVPVSSARTCH